MYDDRLAPPAVPSRLRRIATALTAQLDEQTERLSAAMVEGIPGLPHDEQMRRLLVRSVRANLRTAAAVYAGSLRLTDIAVPDGAGEYARRLAQVEAPPNALARAYRWGQYLILDWAMDELAAVEDPTERLAAVRDLVRVNHWYIDTLSEQVLAAYQTEREEWLAHRSTVRAETLLRVLDGDDVEPDVAGSALGYRLSQTHVAAVVWFDDRAAEEEQPGRPGLEAAARRLVALASGSARATLFWARDPETAWVWFPAARDAPLDSDAARRAFAASDPEVRVAMGGRGSGIAGFRDSHADARLAQRVASFAGSGAPAFISTADPGVRAASLLAGDLDEARRLVRTTLGGLAEDTPAAARLRETVRTVVEEQGGHAAAARRLHVHKNTVGYRLARAAELRGRPLDVGGVDLNLALAAAHWLGPVVLPRPRG